MITEADRVKYDRYPQDLPSQNEKAQWKALVGSIPFNRAYALDDVALRAGIALTRAIVVLNDNTQPRREHAIALVERIAKFESTLWQSWRGTPPPKLPELPRNPLTLDFLPNPYAGDEPDRKGVNAVLQNNPALAALLEKLADDEWGTIYALAAAEADWKSLSAISFTDSDFKSNVFRDKSPEGSRLQGAFRQNMGAKLAEIYKFEAQPVSLSWGASSLHSMTNSKIISSLRENPIPEINADAITVAEWTDRRIVDTLRLALEDEAKAADARLNELRGHPLRQLRAQLP